MILGLFLKGFTAACLTTSLPPDALASASHWCEQHQHQITASVAASARTADASAVAAAPEKKPDSKPAAAPSRWYTSWDSAWKIAHEQGRPLVCVFVHEGCPECDKLNATLKRPAAAKSLASAVKLKLEFSSNPRLVQKWGIRYTPTFLVFSPAHNREVYREVGALSVDRLQTLQPSIEGLVAKPGKAENSSQDEAGVVSTKDSGAKTKGRQS